MKIKPYGDSYRINGFPVEAFNKKLKKFYNTNKLQKLYNVVGMNWFSKKHKDIKINKFFIPEIVFLLNKFKYYKLADTLTEETWYRSTLHPELFPNNVKMDRIKKEMNLTLKKHQEEFILKYDIIKNTMQLYGALLAFDQGLGKTLTSLALMTALGKEKIIIFAPKSTLAAVWEDHIDGFYKKKKRVFIVNRDKLSMDYDFFIFNYESMDKITPIINDLAKISERVGLIVDESHNFLRKSSNRTSFLIDFREAIFCEDVLLMSGTPIKALGVEIIPMLFILDRFFNVEAMDIFKKALGVNTIIGTDIIRNRLHMMMHRKMKTEVLSLPEKTEETIRIKTPNGNEFTLENIKKLVIVFVKERERYHKSKYIEYNEKFDKVIDYADKSSLGKTRDFAKFVLDIEYLRNKVVSLMNEQDREKIFFVNRFEKEVLIPSLPKDLKKQYTEVKSAVKYLNLKIRGEVIGALLMRLRIKMTTSLIAHAGLRQIINDASKKTIIFTSYVDTIEVAYDWLKEIGFDPISIYGKNSKNVSSILKSFRESKKNPLVASLQTISTGVTLVEANTMVFLNRPFRYTEYAQASDRIYRIGQDTPVFIFTILLDTGDSPNLSTSADDITQWSKDMFESMV